MTKTSQRSASVELLRILAMLFIVLGHTATHGFDVATLPRTLNGDFTIAMSQGARIAVDVFVIITCYYSTGETIRWNKIKTLYRQVWFYSVAVLLGVALVLGMRLSPRLLVNACFPIYTSQYWFATCFVGFMLLLPYLNVLLKGITRRAHKQLLFVLLVPLCVIPSITQFTPPQLYSNLLWFLTVGVSVAYLKKCHTPALSKIKWWHGVLLLLLIMAATTAIWHFGHGIKYIRYNAIYLFAELNKLTGIACAVLLFFGFKNTTIEAKQITRISTHVFAAYLITDHPQIREYIFRPVSESFGSQAYPFIYIGWACLLLIVCIGIDMIRTQIDNLIFSKSNNESCQTTHRVD